MGSTGRAFSIVNFRRFLGGERTDMYRSRPSIALYNIGEPTGGV